MSVPERDKVDECFRVAYSAIDPNSGQQAKAIVLALEGVARQLRDSDDTQDMAFRALVEALNESNTTLTASIDSLTQSVQNHERKKGLF